MRAPLALLLLLAPALAGAQTMHKCLDERKQVTYSNVPCDKQGLKPGGTVTQDRVTSMPFTQPAASPAARPPADKGGDKGAADKGGAPKPSASILDPEPAPAGGTLKPNLPGSAPRR
jgi:hypothetical protein